MRAATKLVPNNTESAMCRRLLQLLLTFRSSMDGGKLNLFLGDKYQVPRRTYNMYTVVPIGMVEDPWGENVPGTADRTFSESA
jgi:hypothetical protein